MFDSIRSTRGRVFAAALGAGVLAGAAGLAVKRRRARSVKLNTDVAPNALLCEPTAPMVESWVTTDDGATLRVHTYGPEDGDPIVLVHGWTCSIEYWYPQINALADNYRVIAYDLRGHGKSTIGTARLHADLLGTDLDAVLQATLRGGEKAVVMGHSLGGISVMSWANVCPDHVRQYAKATVLLSTASDRLIAETTAIPLPSRFPRVPVPVGRAMIGAPVPFVDTPITTSVIKYLNFSSNIGAEELAFCAKIVRDCNPRARGGWGQVLSELDVKGGLENLNVPTSVIVGSRDRLTPQAHSHRLAGVLDNAGNLERLTVLPGMGHMSNIEDPDSVNLEVARLASL
ncbi:alpha/beta fold hydrolase [Rhodococcus sp. NPDC058521]|uniref:alpha/beta fold hydrolase n=1 Tax=Rhodococcus sp. NPDC058521 TaxID=3346536 RepID=UPI0036649B36